ncbi:type III toxin-antitoxin system ToxN/AbiQ family toxin [Levilactobacillus enshiensis]|uniref:type III toxin-antitoxin system ToxN/AbiQ family toxin n=1 Tax=Levilactobacillus enshiensis TaxID=2590213 RepID=UPI00117A9F7E|nr:type III toxin-antitoxin system ToxN/AbiQ family toxin [Levilactobacillus enshiensis]
MKLVYVDNRYISYLQKFDSRVLQNKSHRPYIGPILIVNHHEYFAPFETAKPGKSVNKRLAFTIHENQSPTSPALSFLLINDMIPIAHKNYMPIEMQHLKETQSKKFNLLLKEQNFARAN